MYTQLGLNILIVKANRGLLQAQSGRDLLYAFPLHIVIENLSFLSRKHFEAFFEVFIVVGVDLAFS